MNLPGKRLGDLLREKGIKTTPVIEHAGRQGDQFRYAEIRAAIVKAHQDGAVKLPETYVDAIAMLRQREADTKSLSEQ